MLAQEVWPSSSINTACKTPLDESKLLSDYAYLVKRAASHLRSMVGTIVDQDDIQQVGLLGLLSAIRRYGKAVDEYFESYAFKCIRGAMLDEFRRTDWRPRQLRTDAHRLRDAERALTKQLGRLPTEEELRNHLAISTQTLTELRYVLQAESIESLSVLLDEQGEAIFAMNGQDHISSIAMKQALDSLQERQRLVLHLYYQHDLNMKEIALVMNLTESRVCQLHKIAIDRLVNKLS